MTPTTDVTDRNGMKHDEKGLFSKSSASGMYRGDETEVRGGGDRRKGDRWDAHAPKTVHVGAHRDGGRGHGNGGKGGGAPHGRYDDLLTSLMNIKNGLGGKYPGATGGKSSGQAASGYGGFGSGYGGGNHSQPFLSPSHYEPPKPKPVFRLPNVKTEGPKKQPMRYVDSKGVLHKTRVDTITDRPVSEKMEDAINRLYRGEEIPMKEIEAIPEVRNEKRLADAYCTLDEFMHPENYEDKDAKLNEIYRRFSSSTVTPETNEEVRTPEDSYEVKRGHEIWLVTGLPGSGKSTGFVGPISIDNRARVVDSDAIKERMPGFCNGLGAPNVHAQSKSINDRILAESLKRGDNIVYPVLGYNADYVGDQIDTFRRKGYKVHLILNELPFSQSLARCLERRLWTGRNIPLDMFKKVGDRPSEAYEVLKRKVDDYEKHVGDGIRVKLVEKGANKDLPPPKSDRQPTYTYHGKPLHGIETYEHDAHGNLHFGGGGDNGHVADFAKEFQVKPQGKPKYWAKSWLDSFENGLYGSKDAQDAQDGGQAASAAAPCVGLPFRRIDLPEAFDGEIEGYETAGDLARFHYVANDCFDCAD